MHFVDDVDFVFAVLRRVFHRLAQIPHLIHAVVARGIDFNDVQAFFVLHPDAVRAFAAGIAVHRVFAVNGPREDFRGGRLARSPGAAEQIGVGNPVADDLVPQRVDNRPLPHDVGKILRAPLPV